MAVGIGKLGLPSIPIPGLFLAEKISLFPVQQATDRSGTPTPQNSPPPPGFVHPSSPGIVRPTIIPQNVKESYVTPIRRGSDPGAFSRIVIEGVASYKSAVQARMFGGGDGYAKSITNPAKGLPSPPPSDTSEGVLSGGNGYELDPAQVFRVRPFVVCSHLSLTPGLDLRRPSSLQTPWKMAGDLRIWAGGLRFPVWHLPVLEIQTRNKQLIRSQLWHLISTMDSSYVQRWPQAM